MPNVISNSATSLAGFLHSDINQINDPHNRRNLVPSSPKMEQLLKTHRGAATERRKSKPTRFIEMESTIWAFDALHKYTKVLSVSLGYRDQLTRLHSERVHNISAEMGKHCGLDKQELEILQIASLFHDIGKIGIPDQILMKPRGYDDVERDVMKQHPEMGEKIMLSTELDGSEQAALVIRHHHEQYDGQGYPDGLSREEISIYARIISIADSYDAMAETRPYHRPRTHSEIMAILLDETGKKHDPQLMHIFIDIIQSGQFKAAEI